MIGIAMANRMFSPRILSGGRMRWSGVNCCTMLGMLGLLCSGTRMRWSGENCCTMMEMLGLLCNGTRMRWSGEELLYNAGDVGVIV